VRRLTSTTALDGYLDWPGAAQVFEVERVRTARGQSTVEVAYGVTSLTRGRADAKRLLGLARGHWGVADGLHYARDEAPGEDRCRARKGAAAQVPAALGNVAVHLLAGRKAARKAAAARRFAAHPEEAIALLRGA
jgi:hypothetical protein